MDLTEASFQQDGRRVDYRVAGLTAAGRALDAESVPAFEMKLEIEAAPKRRKKSRVGRREKRSRGREKPAPVAKAAKTAKATPVAAPAAVEKALRDWRLAEARRREVPAFRIMSDRTLQAIAAQKPGTMLELLEIPGIGARVAEQYGAQIFRILERG